MKSFETGARVFRQEINEINGRLKKESKHLSGLIELVNNNQPIQPVNQPYQQNMNTNFNVNNNSADGILNKIKNEYFCFEGRINRKFYITRSLIIAVVVMVLYFIIYAATTDIFGIMSDFGMMLTLIVQLVGTVAGISLNIRRFLF